MLPLRTVHHTLLTKSYATIVWLFRAIVELPKFRTENVRFAKKNIIPHVDEKKNSIPC